MLQIQHATNGMDNWLLEAGNDVIREYIQHGHLDQGRDLHFLFYFVSLVSMETMFEKIYNFWSYVE